MDRPGRWDFDPDDDFLVADGIEDSVAVRRQLPDGTYGPAYYGRAAREAPRRSAPGLVEQVDLVWHLHAADFPFDPADRLSRGDRIDAADGSGWVVAAADLAGAADQWRCECVKATGGPPP